ncbi:MAG: ribbon-helix-helix domain-containing protein [Myxococcota bacterium]
MQDASIPAEAIGSSTEPAPEVEDGSKEVVSTHVLVPEEQVLKLRELSRRTRIAQSEYLREAVDDLLVKYGRPVKEEP